MKKVTSILISLIIILVCEIIPINTVLCDENKETKPGNNTIAVLDLEAKSGVDKDTTLMMTEVLRNLIMKTGKYRLLARDKMEEVLKEQNFSTSGRCSTTECQLKIGEILVVQYLVAGTVGKLGKTYIISVQLIDVEKGEVVKSSLEEAESEEIFRIVLDKIANTILETSEVVVVQEKKGNIKISSTPADAEIIINDTLMGKTPYTIKELEQGTYILALKKQGYKDILKNITIQAGKTITENINLEKIALIETKPIKETPITLPTDKEKQTFWQSPLVPTGLSLVLPGTGQLYNGDTWSIIRGIVYLGGTIGCYLLIEESISTNNKMGEKGLIGFSGLGLLTLIAPLDAYFTSESKNK